MTEINAKLMRQISSKVKLLWLLEEIKKTAEDGRNYYYVTDLTKNDAYSMRDLLISRGFQVKIHKIWFTPAYEIDVSW